MKRRLISLGVLCALVAATVAATASGSPRRVAGDELNGAGSSFVFPLVSTWQAPFRSGSGIKVNYNPVGSGGGIKAISGRTVDFGASDAPLTPEQAADCKGCVQIPWALSATAVAYKGKGLPNHLKLTGRVIADIFLGKITTWDDAAIKALNKSASLPSTRITPVFRSDGSGTSYNFTDYLAAVSPEFKSKVGVNTLPSFPVGVGGAKSAGVAGGLSHMDGAIGYNDVAYTPPDHFSLAALKNTAGKFAPPGPRGVVSAPPTTPATPSACAAVKTARAISPPRAWGGIFPPASPVKWGPAKNDPHIVNPPKAKPNAYPICTFSYVILPTKTDKAKQLRQYVF